MYTEEQIKHDREYVKDLLRNLSSRVKNMWLVCVVWESPITHSLEHREGYFLDYTEAKLFSDMLADTYDKKYKLRNEVYFFKTEN